MIITMNGTLLIRFYDFYEAHLVAHRLQIEGYRTEVLEYTYSTASGWGNGGFRLLGVPRGEAISEEMGEGSGPMNPGETGRFIDEILRILALALIVSVPVTGIIGILKFAEATDVPVLVFPTSPWPYLVVLVVLIALGAGFWACVAIYSGYRRGGQVSTAIFKFTGWVLVISWAGIALIVVLPLIAIKERAGEEPRSEESDS